MPQKVRGVVARSKGAPVTIETIVIPDPGPGEAVVAVQACGVCHTDLHYREGGINDEFPFLLGHEAAGVVESVGEGVTNVKPGDFVILNWRAVCGNCRSCLRGRPWLCFNTFNATQKMTLEDGTVLSPALGIGAFADKTLVAAGQCTKVDPSVPATTAGLLGCGVMAGSTTRQSSASMAMRTAASPSCCSAIHTPPNGCLRCTRSLRQMAGGLSCTQRRPALTPRSRLTRTRTAPTVPRGAAMSST